MSNQLKSTREKLGLSQEAVARLLGVSLKSVYRWENGKFEADAGNDAILQLIPILAAGKLPQACKDARKHGLDTAFLAGHVPGCLDCRAVLAYLTILSSKGNR